MRRSGRSVLRLLGLGGLLWVILSLGGSTSRPLCPSPEQEIFQGVAFGCEVLVPSPEGKGRLFWARIDLAAPGIDLYVTPQDPQALSRGWQYRLRWIGDVVRDERLSMAINGTLFTSTPTWRPRFPGDLAKSVETVVA